MKKILGLDLGTNSIGWAVINTNFINEELKPISIVAAGSRIIPMDAATLGDFEKGNTISQTAERTGFRGVRRLKERTLLRRERLHRVLQVLDFLPPHYSNNLNRYGQILLDKEPKLAWHEIAPKQFEFIFKDSFNEMVMEFKRTQPQLFQVKSNGEETKIPYDWTIYYLRKKALTQKITKEELAWLLLHFNQKRGYYQLRGEDEEETPNKSSEFHALKVISVEDSGDRKGKDIWYNIHLENGWIYRRTASIKPDWEGKIKEFIVTTDLENDGTAKTDKEGNIKRSFRMPSEGDWTLLKKKTEYNIDQTHKTVGQYIYDALLQNPNQKIKGSLVRTIERKYYKAELKQILETQCILHKELRDRTLYQSCIEELYSHNEAHRNNISNLDFVHLFLNDILFYQRPLKSKKSLISNCPYEEHKDKTGNIRPIKCIAKSQPLYQEFRLWQFITNLRIFEREKEVDGKLTTDVDVTNEFLKTENDWVALYEWLNNRKEIEQNVLLGTYFKIKRAKGKETQYLYRWNYVEDKKYPCNETRALLLSGLDKAGIPTSVLSPEVEEALWHILYSVEDKNEIERALTTFMSKYNENARNEIKLNELFVKEFARLKPFKKEYGAYSAKATRKLVSLMRMGKYWNEGNIDSKTKERINKIIDGEVDESIRDRVREKIRFNDIAGFQGLPLWLACYVVYDRHSEAKDTAKWKTPSDIDGFLKDFKQHSLRNPIVEKVVTETLRTVRDIWSKYGDFAEIHVELGREMKNPADKRAKMTESIRNNENTNLRIKAMLAEFANSEYQIEGVRPYSPSQQDILRIYEDYALSNLKDDDTDFDFISKISKASQPSKSDILRYKLWLEQKYRSPYTGKVIPLGKLFTTAYDIEHVIPQSRYFDDSFSNKVICEKAINQLKDRMLGYEFIKNNSGRIYEGHTIFTIDQYEEFIKDNYAKNRGKMKKLLLEEIPDSFIERQLNDSRYISKLVVGLLSNIVREDGEQEAKSKHVIPCNGSVTDRLKKDWGMNDVWNKMILPRFIRLNEITGTDHFTTTNLKGHTIPHMPLELQKGFSKKRIDHRHHAMDAIVIACTTASHVNLLNNESAKTKDKGNRFALQRKLRRVESIEIKKNGESKEIQVFKEFYKPWENFAVDAEKALNNIIVSFKQNLRVINKSSNYYTHYNKEGKKVAIKQGHNEQGNKIESATATWDIRKPMHKDTVSGEVNLRKIKTVSLNEAIKNPKTIVEKDLKNKIVSLLHQELTAKDIKKYFEDNKDAWNDINLSKISVYYFTKATKDRFFATRKALDTSFDSKKIENSITDTGIQKILLRHLASKNNDPELAFSADGIDELNKNIIGLNNGKYHKPITKVRVYEKGDKFAVGQTGNKRAKYVEAAKGTNLFFAVYEVAVEDKKSGEIMKKRTFATIPLNEVIERQKKGLNVAPNDENGNQPIFVLSPNDLVYLPKENEIGKSLDKNTLDKSRIYKMVSCTGKRLYFVPQNVANSIIDKVEFSQLNKIEFSSEKEIILPIDIDRLGNIKAIFND